MLKQELKLIFNTQAEFDACLLKFNGTLFMGEYPSHTKTDGTIDNRLHVDMLVSEGDVACFMPYAIYPQTPSHNIRNALPEILPPSNDLDI